MQIKIQKERLIFGSVIRKILRKIGKRITSYFSVNFDNRTLPLFDIYSKVFAERLVGVEGYVVECGFGRGRSFALLAHLARQQGRKIVGFDSFSGFPKISEFDKSHRNARPGEWSVRTISEAKEFIASLGYQSFAEVHKMVFDPIATNPIPDIPIAFLHVDLYEGYESALNLFWSQVAIGGVVLFDEYGTEAWPGATKAVNDFVSRLSLTIEVCRSDSGMVKHFISKRY